jgi:hypothetical protein
VFGHEGLTSGWGRPAQGGLCRALKQSFWYRAHRPHESLMRATPTWMKTWIREETRRGLREAEDWRREGVRFHFEILKRFREEQRRRREERHFTP